MVMVIEQLHYYLFGRCFTVHTDHSSLVQIFAKQLKDVSPRLQCMLLRLSQFQFDVKYVNWKHVPLADCLSRLCSNNSKEDPSLDVQIAEPNHERCNIGEISHGCAKRMARIMQILGCRSAILLATQTCNKHYRWSYCVRQQNHNSSKAEKHISSRNA